MPFTPFHLGPAATIGFPLRKYFDVVTLLIASVIVDLEPLAVIMFNLNYPLHGFFHTFIGGSIMAIVLSIIIYRWNWFFQEIAKIFRISQDSSFRKIIFTSFVGVYSHILLDAPLYTDIRPFYPVMVNPLYGIVSASTIYMFCEITILTGLLFYIITITSFPAVHEDV
ncbi:MAG: hydrolase [Candidatus Asgardarchaeia archaeon]